MAGLAQPGQPASARRILITGLSSQLGGRLAQALEREPHLEAIIGIDTEDPRHELARTEFVRVAVERRALRRIISAAAIDTILDTRLLADPLAAPLRTIRVVDVADTHELLGACSAADSPVRQVVFKSSATYYGWHPGDPAFLSEDMVRPRPVRSTVEHAIVAAERAVKEFALAHRDCRVAVLRLADQLGAGGRTSLESLLSLPVLPAVLGFDPRFSLVYFDDVVGSLLHAVRRQLHGIYNVAADGVLVLSEVASLLGKTLLPVLPPWGTALAAMQLRRLGLRVPVELLRQLRYGRGLDNRRLKATGYSYGYTGREALIKLGADQRLRPMLGSGTEPYRYDPDLEEFLRWSPSVQSAGGHAPPAPPPLGYDGLGAGELLDLIPSLEPDALATLRAYEAAHQRRAAVLEALDRTLALKRG